MASRTINIPATTNLDADELTSGTVPFARLSVGTGSTQVAAGDHTHTAADTGAIPASIIDAKGDVIVGTAADTAARLGVGANRKTLTANSSQTTGVSWEWVGGDVSPRVTSGWYSAGAARGGAANTVATGNDTTVGRAWLVWLNPGGVKRTLEGIGLPVLIGGDSGAKIRFGVYAANPSLAAANADALVGGLMADSGQIAANASGFKSVTGLSIDVPGEGVWLGFVGQSFATAAQVADLRNNSNRPVQGPTPISSTSDTRGGALMVTGITGAWPSTLTGLTHSGAGVIGWLVPDFYVRWSA